MYAPGGLKNVPEQLLKQHGSDVINNGLGRALWKALVKVASDHVLYDMCISSSRILSSPGIEANCGTQKDEVNLT